METKESKKKTYSSEAPSMSAAPAREQDKINFDHWFMVKVNQKRKVQAHHYDAIWAFFKKQGLSENESQQKFDSALKAFGY